MGKLSWRNLLIIVWLGINLEPATSDANVTKLENPLRVKNMTGKVTNARLEPHTIDVFYHTLTKQEVLDLIRVSVEIIDPSVVKDRSGTVLEVSVSNGRDNFVLQLPVQYPNLTQYSDGKLLNPLEEEDFGKKKKKSKHNKNGDNSTNLQNLVITVHSRLQIEIEYKLTITHLDRSQYIIKFKPGETKLQYANQHVTIVKPIGYFLDGNAQKVRAFHITVTSDDDLCANLIALPANESLYNRRIDLKEVDNRRILSFTRRADVFLSEKEIESFGSFKIFAIITPDDSACSVNNSRKYPGQNKKLTFAFEKLDDMSYTLPIIAMIIFLATPTLLFVPFITLIRNQQNETSLETNLINISSDVSEPSRSPIDVQRDNSLTNNVEIIEFQEGIAGVELAETPPSDSLTLHGKMIQYPVAIILPVLMHTAVEYHKWTISTMANRDEMCFHNHACAKPYGELRAWNDIISNLGYLLYGSVFVAVTLIRRRRFSVLCGTHECILIDVTIGVFMTLQAIASATYHICPSDVAFQFDTPCIQVICTLLIIRQWLVRVECPSAAHSNILLVAVVFLNFFISAFSKTFYVRYILATIHIVIIAGVCYAKKRMISTPENFSKKRIVSCFTSVFSIFNIFLLMFYLTSSLIHLNQIVTYCCIFNCILYLMYYALMKVVCKERISTGAQLYGILAVSGWILAASFFFQDDTDWTRSPAASRALNKPCLLFDFFGAHDLWHIFGALGGLFTFLFVSVVDDDLFNTPKKAISVF